MISFRKSKFGLSLALIFLLTALAAFLLHIYSMKTNPGDDGLSGIFFWLFTLPWSFMIPNSLCYSGVWRWLAYPVSWAMVTWNALLLYCIVGGVRLNGSKNRKLSDPKGRLI